MLNNILFGPIQVNTFGTWQMVLKGDYEDSMRLWAYRLAIFVLQCTESSFKEIF